MTDYADLEGAARIARIAADFDWTWMRSDVPRRVELRDGELSTTSIRLSVNGQFDVPAGGQVKVPTLCGMF